jgi:hypothetical protein
MVEDQDRVRDMEEMALSKFKATCLATLERVQPRLGHAGHRPRTP